MPDIWLYAGQVISKDIILADPTAARTAKIKLYVTTNITAGGAQATTAQLTPPGGKTTGNFTTGDITDDTNPPAAVDIAVGNYTEFEFSIIGPSTDIANTFEFRIKADGVLLSPLTVTPSQTLTTTTSLSGTASITFGQSGALGLAGSAAITFAQSGSLGLAGTSAITFAQSGALGLAGVAAIIFGQSGALGLAGSAAITFGQSGGLGLAGSSAITFGQSAGLGIAGSTTITFGASGTLGSQLFGTAAITFGQSGALGLAGVGAITFDASGTLATVGLSGTATITFGATGTLLVSTTDTPEIREVDVDVRPQSTVIVISRIAGTVVKQVAPVSSINRTAKVPSR